MGSAKFSQLYEVDAVARAELGTKRVCPETGKKFYDLDKDPIVSPYTGKEYPRSFFEETPSRPEKATVSEETKKEAPADADSETEEDDESAPEFISLEDADGDSDDDTDDDDDDEEAIATLPDVDIDVEDEDSDDDTFLEEEEEDDDLSDVIGDGVEGDEEV